jgi:hypothetical protein
MTGGVKFATSTAPRPPLADLVSNPTPPGQISRDRASLVIVQLAREMDWPVLCSRLIYETCESAGLSDIIRAWPIRA